MTEKQNTPEIRFEGFTDPWEQRKLGEFSKKRTIKNADGTLSETFTNSAEQGVISQLDYFDHDITNDANISGYYVVQPDDFVYNPRISATAPCGPINRNRLNRAGVMSPLYTVFSVDASVDKTYLEHYFKTSRWHDFMFLEGNSGARSDRFSISDATFFEMPIWCPEISEQKAIAKQLETADRLITLHQRKYDKLCMVKKSMLGKMFPKPGETEPEIRFDGFTDPWEQRKLGELCEVNPTTVLPRSFEYVDLESVVGTDMVSHRREEKLTAPSRAQRLASFGDIFYQTVRPYQKNNYFYELPDKDYVFSTGYAQLRPLCDGRFLFSSLQREQFVSCVLEHCTGTSYPAINANDLAALSLAVPSDIEEQRLVGTILKPIDALITLHQRKLELLRNIKRSLLDRMFV